MWKWGDGQNEGCQGVEGRGRCLIYNQNHDISESERSPINNWSEWPSSKNLQTRNAGKGVEKREPSCTVGGNVN